MPNLQRVIGCAYTVYNTLGANFFESVYENSMLIELRRSGLKAVPQLKLDVYNRSELVGHFFADIVVNDLVILELKAVEQIAKAQEAQLVNYLAAAKFDLGLLINFSPKEVQIERKVRDLSQLPPI